MKKIILLTLGLFVLSSSAAQAVIIAPDGSSDVPGAVLFNFQVPSVNEGALPDNFQSQVDNAISITNHTVNIMRGTGWLDGPATGGPAGLGVCQTSDCDGSTDDNHSLGESITLFVSETIKAGDIYFRDGFHGTSFTGSVGIAIDGGMLVQYTLAAILSDLADQDILSSITFSLTDTKASDFYVAGFGAPVPLPAALPMMIMGLLGLFGFRKFSA